MTCSRFPEVTGKFQSGHGQSLSLSRLSLAYNERSEKDDRMLVNFNFLLPSMLLEPGVQRACELGLQEVLLPSMLVPRSTPASPPTSLQKSEG